MRKATRRNGRVQERPQYKCRHCANSYDWHEIGYDGKPFLCRCPYKQQGGKYCIFLNDPACDDNFKLRPEYAETDKQV